jgi:hypothetical protein
MKKVCKSKTGSAKNRQKEAIFDQKQVKNSTFLHVFWT